MPQSHRGSRRTWYVAGGAVAAAVVLGVGAFAFWPSSRSSASSSPSYSYSNPYTDSSSPSLSDSLSPSSSDSSVTDAANNGSAGSWSDFAWFSVSFGTYDHDTAGAWRHSDCVFRAATTDHPEQVACSVDAHASMFLEYWPDGAASHLSTPVLYDTPFSAGGGSVVGHDSGLHDSAGNPAVQATFCAQPDFALVMKDDDGTQVSVADVESNYFNQINLPTGLTACTDQSTGAS